MWPPPQCIAWAVHTCCITLQYNTVISDPGCVTVALQHASQATPFDQFNSWMLLRPAPTAGTVLCAASGSRQSIGRLSCGIASCKWGVATRPRLLAPLRAPVIQHVSSRASGVAARAAGGSSQPTSWNPVDVVKREQGLQSNRWALQAACLWAVLCSVVGA